MLGEELPVAPAPEAVLPKGAAYHFEDGALRLSITLSIYTVEAILRSCYWLTDRCYAFLSKPDPNTIEITLASKSGEQQATDALAWTFLNDLIDQQLRIEIGRETGAIREMIVAQAFADVDVVDDRGRPVSEGHDPPDEPPVRTWRPVS